MVTRLKDYITHQDRARRAATLPSAVTHSVQEQEEVGDVCIFRSAGLNAVSVALPAGIDLEIRAARMNAFWKALVGFQDRDVFVVGTCAGQER